MFFVVAIPLVPGVNRVRITASDVDGNWAYDELELSFVPGTDGPAVHVSSTYPQEGLNCVRVAGDANGLVALEWRNELTGASAAIDRDEFVGYPVDLTAWSKCVPVATGMNRITVRGTGWNGAIVEDSVAVGWPP